MKFRSERGQASVELALVLPVLLLILFGIMEFGRVFSAYLVITNAAREGARQAAIGVDDVTIRSTVREAAYSLNLNDSNIDITPNQSSRVTGTPVTVTVNYSVDLVVPIISSLAPDPLPLRAQSVMRVE